MFVYIIGDFMGRPPSYEPKSHLSLSISGRLMERAREVGMNISEFVETKLMEELDGVSIPEIQLFNRIFRQHYSQTSQIKVRGVESIVVKAYIRMLHNAQAEARAALLEALEAEDIDKTKLKEEMEKVF